jgi:hypothetical protein
MTTERPDGLLGYPGKEAWPASCESLSAGMHRSTQAVAGLAEAGGKGAMGASRSEAGRASSAVWVQSTGEDWQ